jgi:hypothetical protein
LRRAGYGTLGKIKMTNKYKSSYTLDKKEKLQVRVPSWMLAKLQDVLPPKAISEFVRQAIEEKIRKIDSGQEVSNVTNG